MKHKSGNFICEKNITFPITNLVLLLFLICITNLHCCLFASSSLKTLPLNGYLNFDQLHYAARDFGNRYQFLPFAVLHPKSVSDVATTIKHIWKMGPISKLTVAARGHGHSLSGQSQAHRGVVINMESLSSAQKMIVVYTSEQPYVDVSGGELWINILHQTLKYGLAPKSWTDYLHLTVGGTLSNAGISGQAFRHGPQISNVLQLFHGVLGGLGQFGIITRAKISLEPAPKMVKWIRVLYSDFFTFARDQEHLISIENTFDYLEGFAIINRTGLLNNWRSSFNPQDPLQASQFQSDGKTLFCLELAKHSAVLPEEDEVLYLVAFLSSADPFSTYYTTQEEWRAHFGPHWQAFIRRKSAYDPLAILGPGQKIFQKGKSVLRQQRHKQF